MSNIKISDLPPAALPLDTANTLFEVTVTEAGLQVSRKITADDLTIQGTITVEDEGTPLATGADTLNFTGAGVTASGTGSTKTINIPGGSGGQVDSVVGGTNINVDATDPVNPIVNLDAAITGVSVNGVTLTTAGVATNFLDETGNYSAPSVSAGGANTNIQYNNAGALDGDAEFTWNSVQGQLRLTHDQPGGSGRDCFIIDVERPSASAIVVTTNEVGPGNVILEMEADTGAADGFRLETSWFGAQADHFMRFVNGGGVDQLVLRFDGLAQMGGVTFDQPNTTIELGAQILEFTERASANPSAATIGQLWVRNDTPNVLVFTDDTGTDTVLGAGGGGTPGGVNTDIQFNNAGSFGGSTDLQWTGTALELGGSLFDFVPTALLTNARMQMRNAAGGVSIDQNASTGVCEISQTNPGGVDEDLWITLNRNADVKLFHNNVEVARTDSLANGGFEVNNTVTGAGFERVLTTSDLGGGGGVNSVTAGTNLNDTGTAADPILNVDDPLIIGSINATSALNDTTVGSPYANVPLNIGANLVGTQGMVQYSRQRIQARPSSFGYNSTLFINIQGEPGTNGANTFIGGLNSAGIEVDFGVEVNLRHGVAPGNSAPVMSTFTRGIKLPQGSLYITQTLNGGANDTNSGQFWVRNDTVQKPMFTDDAGRDHNLIAEFDEQTSDTTVNNSTTLVNTQIDFSDIPTGHYRIDMLVLLRDVAVTGCGARVQISLSGADPDSVMRVVNKNFSGAGAPSYDEVGLVSDLFDNMPLVTGSGTSRYMFSGIVEFISGTNGFTVQFAQNTALVGDLDFESGSWCSLSRVGP